MGVLAAASVIRLGLLTTQALALDGDEAVTGMVARDILAGRHRAFFPGEERTGTLEQYLQAVLLWVLPDSASTLRLAQVLLAVGCCFLVHQIALRCRLSSSRALFAAALFAAGPYFSVYWGAKSRGSYGVAMLLGLLGLWLVLSRSAHDPRQVARTAAFGVVTGLAFWNDQQALYLLLPAAWWLAATVRRHGATAYAAAWLGFVVGALPALWHTFDRGTNPFPAFSGGHAFTEGAHHFLVDTIPDLLGLRDDGSPLTSWLPPALITVVVLMAIGVAVDRHRRGLTAILALKTADRSGVDLLLLALLVTPVLRLLSDTATDAGSVKHVFVLFGIIPVLLAALPVPVWTPERLPRASWGVLGVALFALHTLVGSQLLIAEFDGGQPVAAGEPVTGEHLDEVIAVLRSTGTETAYADYWLAHPVNWDADGDVVVESLVTRRIPRISEAVQADPSPGLIISAREVADVSDALEERGVQYEVDVVGRWAVISGMRPGLHLPQTLSMVDAVRAAS